MEEGNHLDPKMLTVVESAVSPRDPKMLMVVGLVASPPDRRTPTGEAMDDGHLGLTMLMELGDK